MTISKYTTLEEAIYSATAIRWGIDNSPTDVMTISNMSILCDKIYDPLCDLFGFKLPFTSFFRNKDTNRKVGGSVSSQHVLGQAIDICPNGKNSLSNADLFEYIRKSNLPYDQLIWEYGSNTEPSWVHVSYSSRNRREALKIYREDKKIIKEPYVD
jgi:hypothetical protein